MRPGRQDEIPGASAERRGGGDVPFAAGADAAGADLELGPRGAVRGRLRPPGDKSVSHRALLFAAAARGTSRIRGLAPGADVAATRRALEALGVAVADEGGASFEERGASGEEDGGARRVVVVRGAGWAALDRAADAAPLEIDCANSGTSARLLLGLLAGTRGRFLLRGDASLSARPMARVAAPLRAFGARIEERPTLPLLVDGAALRGASVATGAASAQVKSALILAALQARGASVVVEPAPTRDHTERLLAAMGAPLRAAGTRIEIDGGRPDLAPLDLDVPGDPSSAAYAAALAALDGAGDLVVEDALLSPRRTGFYRLLAAMGADVELSVARAAPEEVGTIVVRGGRPLRGVDVAGQDVVDAVDELPLLAVVAAQARGRTTIRGAAELRVKESDRIAATVRLLRAFGARAEELPDGLVVEGPAALRGAAADAGGDHRLAMCAAVAAARASGPSLLRGGEWVRISYPSFFADLDRLTGGAAGRGRGERSGR